MISRLAISTVLAHLAVYAQPPAARPQFAAFEVATIKPTPDTWGNGGRFYRMEAANEFVARNYALRVLISAAYNLNPKTITGGPDWIDQDHYDIVARTPGDVRPNRDEQMVMLRDLLTDRFALRFHREKREMPVYELTIAKGGPKLTPSTWTPDGHPEGPPLLAFNLSPEVIRVPARYATTTELTDILQRAAFDRPVLDKTGLTARYDFDLEFTPDSTLFNGALRDMPTPQGDNLKPGLFAALQEQLGLKLESARAPVDIIVIDKIERPSEN